MLVINNEKYDIDGILFDKDGTIIDFTLWINWAKAFIDQMNSSDSVLYNAGDLADLLGFSYHDRTWDPQGALAIGSLQDLLTIFTLGLYKQGLSWDQAYKKVHDTYQTLEKTFPIHEHIKSTNGLVHFLEQAKINGIQMAVVTADNYSKAVRHLETLGVKDYFSTIVGHDLVQNGKPYPDMVYYACDQLDINPEKTLIIGDSNGDMILGKNSALSASIGIVPASSTKTEHLRDADHIIHDYEMITFE